MKKNQTKDDITVSTLFLRKIVIIFLSIVVAMCTGFTILYTAHDISPFKHLLYVYTLQHVIWLFGFCYFKNLSSDSLIMVYISYILVALYPFACIYWNSGCPVVFSWYLLIIIGVIVFQTQNIELWITLILAVVISIFFFSSLFPQISFTPLLITRTNILTVISTIILSAFFAVIYVKKNRFSEFTNVETETAAGEDTANLKRDIALYNDIIEYLEKSKSFKNPHFNAQTLATALNSNVNYISKAISTGGKTNFNMLLNNFRINYVKSMLDSDAHKKYTIDYIYAEAGYQYRSTFNTAFKKIIGMTPSDYVSLKNTVGTE